jgi:hypothetical protein
MRFDNKTWQRCGYVAFGVASRMAGISQDQVKAARPLSGSCISPAHDWWWVDFQMAAFVPLFVRGYQTTGCTSSGQQR